MLIDNLSTSSSALPFDVDVLRAYLAARLPELSGDITLRPFSSGQSNPTYLIEGANARFVLRKKPAGPILPSAHQIDREYRVMKALESTPVPVPAMALLCEDSDVIGTSFYVMEAVEGRIYHDCLIPGATPAERTAMYLAMAETLADLHAVDWRAKGLEDFGRTEGYLERQIALWTKQYERSRQEPIPAMEQLAGWLAEQRPATSDVTIAHGDYRLGNLVFAADDPRIVAVLDWELATLGDPLADLAYTCLPYYLPSGLPGIPGLADIDIAALGIPGEQDLVAAYCARSGRATIPSWNFYLAFALFRTAAILQGIYSRALQNNAASTDAIEVGKNAAFIADVGWRVTQTPNRFG